MSRGSLMIEASLILPVIMLVLIMIVSICLFHIIRINNELEMFMEFAKSGHDETSSFIDTNLPLLPFIKLEFYEKREEFDYGRSIQRSRIIPDIFKD